MNIAATLEDLRACEDAIEWVEKQNTTADVLWLTCQNGQWLLWLLWRLDLPLSYKQKLAQVIYDRWILPYLPSNDELVTYNARALEAAKIVFGELMRRQEVNHLYWLTIESVIVTLYLVDDFITNSLWNLFQSFSPDYSQLSSVAFLHWSVEEIPSAELAAVVRSILPAWSDVLAVLPIPKEREDA